MAFDIQKYIETYAEEAREQLQALKQGLAALAANPRDAEVLSSLHRSAHTVKGGARMLKLTAINELALQLEAVLTLLRDGRVAYGPELSDLIQRSGDVLSSLVEDAAAGRPPGADFKPLCAGLAEVAARQGSAAVPAPAAAAPAPAAAAPAPAAAAPAPAVAVDPGSKAGRQRRILVVDDSLLSREAAKDLLAPCGYLVDSAPDGEAGLRLAVENAYDLVITDVEMPQMDGFALTARLRALEARRGIPIIIMSSRAEEDFKQRGLAAGANAYLVKGSGEPTQLQDTVRTLLP